MEILNELDLQLRNNDCLTVNYPKNPHIKHGKGLHKKSITQGNHIQEAIKIHPR